MICGKVCSIEHILSKQPNLRVLRDPPPSLEGKRVRYVLIFHLDPENSSVQRCKVRAYAWTIPSFPAILRRLDKTLSTIVAETVYSVAKKQFEQDDPKEIAATRAELQVAAQGWSPLVSLSFPASATYALICCQ